MIPLRDNIPSRRFPLMNTALIAANLAVFFHELGLASTGKLHQFILEYGLVPARIDAALLRPDPTSWSAYSTLITAIFIHGGWVHVLGNMLFLWVFGDNVEDRMGAFRYLVFFLLVGAIGNLAHALANPGLTAPTVGASGAVAGVLGAYMVSYPRARVLTLVFLGIFFTVLEIPAVLFLLYWFFLQVANGVASLSPMARLASGVAWWAHIGGFVSGMVLLPWFQRYRWRPPFD